MKSRFIVFSAFALLFSACAAPRTTQPVTQPVEPVLPTNENLFTPVPSVLPTGGTLPTPESTLPPVQSEPLPTTENLPATTMVTYTDEVAGFSLDYPADWFIDASATSNAQQAFAYSVSIATWDLRNPLPPGGKGSNGIPTGGTKIDVGVVKQSMTLEEALAQPSQNESGSPVLARKDVTLANGLSGVILDFEGPAGPVRTLITVLNGNVIYVSGYGDLEQFESIALTLRAK
jgi:hypothetical protein